MKQALSLTSMYLLPVFGWAVLFPIAWGQAVKPKPQDSRLTDWLPDIGTQLPPRELYDKEGNPFPTADFKDHYTVLVFGCLT